MNQTLRQHTGHGCHIEGIDIPASVFSDRNSLIQAARKGLPGDVIRQAVSILGHREVFVRLMGTTGGNLNRYYRRKALSPVQSEVLLDMLCVFARAITVFGDIGSAREWLETAIPALGGHSPLEMCDTFAGRALVQGALNKIEYGEFA
ncbi:MAG: DUF2384 domain-containing protein [Gammaproteobacteria bacterium]|nr:DUF2384 domain-containing protein [Gammaproteobacteria bacterium]MDE0514027.1 DUF2384 domain-containing protein [Gammaproteobacteria bacterium]